MTSCILFWNKDIGFVRCCEGNGTNLFPEDEDKGYVDYMMLDFLECDGFDFVEIDGAQVMLNELYQEKFQNEMEVIQHLIDCSWIPDVEYKVLWSR